LVIAFQAAAYGSSSSVFTAEMMQDVLDHHMIAHHQKEEWKNYTIPSGNKIANLIADHPHKATKSD